MAFPEDLLIESFRGRERPATWAAAIDCLLSTSAGGILAREISPLLDAMADAADSATTAALTSEQRAIVPDWLTVLPLASAALAESNRGQRTNGPALITRMAAAADAA